MQAGSGGTAVLPGVEAQRELDGAGSTSAGREFPQRGTGAVALAPAGPDQTRESLEQVHVSGVECQALLQYRQALGEV